MKDLPDFIYNSPLVAGLSREKVNEVFQRFKWRMVKKGETLFEMNKKARNLYIVISGEFKVVTENPAGQKVRIARSIPGDILGEVALLTGETHSGSVIAELDSEVIYISKNELKRLMSMVPDLAINLGQIEAERLRNQILGKRRITPDDRFIAHLTSYDSLEAHYVGLNVASAISIADNQPVAYLHLSQSPQTPCRTLDIGSNLSPANFDKIYNSLKHYRNLRIKNLMLEHNSGLSLLPCPAHSLPIRKLAIRDFPKLLGNISQHFSYIFMDFGNEALTSKKVVSLLKQADKILIGVRRHENPLQKFNHTLRELEQFIPGFRNKVVMYVNDIDIPPPFMEAAQAVSEPSRSRIPRILGPFVQVGLMKGKKSKQAKNQETKTERPTKQTVITNTVLREMIGYEPTYFLRGKLPSLSAYIGDSFLTENKVYQKARASVRSLGRWLSNRSRGLALGGGGARAVSEIGFLRIAEKEQIHFDFISGTSMGAVIGAMWAIGYNSHEIEDLFQELLPEDKAFFDYSLPIVSFFKGRKVNVILKKIFGNRKIEDLSIPFVCIAADILSGQVVVFEKGLLWRAVRASMSLPVIFPPVRYRNYYLIDGGALNNVPGDVLKQNNVHRVIGINCTPINDTSIAEFLDRTGKIRRLRFNRNFWKSLGDYLATISYIVRRPPILKIAYQAMMMEGGEVIRLKKHYFDYMVNMKIAEFGLFDFHLREEIIRAGERTTLEYLPDIMEALGIETRQSA